MHPTFSKQGSENQKRKRVPGPCRYGQILQGKTWSVASLSVFSVCLMPSFCLPSRWSRSLWSTSQTAGWIEWLLTSVWVRGERVDEKWKEILLEIEAAWADIELRSGGSYIPCCVYCSYNEIYGRCPTEGSDWTRPGQHCTEGSLTFFS